MRGFTTATAWPQASEFLVNTDSNPCANPAVAAAADGSFMVAWGAIDLANPTNSWDIYARPFSSAGAGGAVVRVNSYLYWRPVCAAHQRDRRGLYDRLDEPGAGRFARGRFWAVCA